MTAVGAGHCVVIVQPCVMVVLPLDSNGSPETKDDESNAHMSQRHCCLNGEIFYLHIAWKERTRARRVSHDQPGPGESNWRNRTH
jgi:hypothetical protein